MRSLYGVSAVVGLSCATLLALGLGASTGCDSGAVPIPPRDAASSEDAAPGEDAASPDAATAPDAEAGASLPPCGKGSPEALAACIEEARYVTDLTFIAAERTPGSEHWQEVQDLCATRFTELGYEVELHAFATGVNVIGVRRGTSAAGELVLLGAHYDHIAGCAGADDNATGVAGVLEGARVLAMRSHTRTIAVACWDKEEEREPGSASSGADAYALRARARNDVIVGNFVLEAIGYKSSEPNTQHFPEGMETLFPAQVSNVQANENRGDFLAVVLDSPSHEDAEQIATHARALGLPIELFEVPEDKLMATQFSDLRRSDHSAFWATGYPGIMLTDTAEFRNPGYHCRGGQDTVDVLDHEFATKVVRASTAAVAHALARP